MDEAVLDSDILSEVLKGKDRQVAMHARQYLSQHLQLAFSTISYYEILRGIKAKGAIRQLKAFQQVCGAAKLLPVTLPILARAAELWAVAGAGGHPRGDADLIVAATALEIGRVLITGNASHFAWIPGLQVEDWRRPCLASVSSFFTAHSPA